MKIICSDFHGEAFYKCPNSITYYTIDAVLPAYSEFSALCDNDPKFYQTCGAGHSDVISRNSDTISQDSKQEITELCGYYICQDSGGVFTSGWTENKNYLCDGKNQCANTALDELDCEDMFSGSSSDTSIAVSRVCDGVCDMLSCRDEAECNGFRYGILDGDNYYPPIEIGSEENFPEVVFGSDGSRNVSSLRDHQTCQQTVSELTVPIFNYTRCATFLYTFIVTDILSLVRQPQAPYCSNFLDQTNCTDEERVALSCDIRDYPSTVSTLVICHGHQDLKICDNGIENTCFQLSFLCNVHKHKMCDGTPHCEDRSDELHTDCLSMTQQGDCVRILGNHKGPIPLAWLHDGLIDCESGVDESGISWPTCGVGDTYRFVPQNTSCLDDFLCYNSDIKFIGRDLLCDKIDTCGNENEICSISRGTPELATKPISSGRLDKHFVHCYRGLERLQEIFGFCLTKKFSYPEAEIFGMLTTTALHFPFRPMNCDHTYGEIYLYLSCSGRCVNSTCPLQRPLKHTSCPGKIQNRIYTLINNKHLTFVTQVEGSFRNDYFLCENNGNCISYDRVCNLVKDCEDGSDEDRCTNHFRCHSTGDYITKSQYCDGAIDCQDLSDECNVHCGNEIIDGVFLKVLSWTIGSLAVIFNIIIIVKTTMSLNMRSSHVMMLNSLLIILISIADFLIGGYLLAISINDTFMGIGYCVAQMEWKTSNYCSILGVLSTIGSQMSLFSMTILSLTRFLGIKNTMSLGRGGSGKKMIIKNISIVVSVVLLSTIIAVIPIFPGFEDFFVNGVKYSSSNPLFIGISNKYKHAKMISAYYSRIKYTHLTWAQSNALVDGMFSNYYGGIARSNVNFYGNDGVCLFKYFVLQDDPQKLYVWIILMINFTSFLIISCSYLYINCATIRSSRTLTVRKIDKGVTRRNRKLQRKVSIIILTDFLCWVPFITVCGFHSLGIMDASPWYALFSIVILPINSVINPLLYDNTITDSVRSTLRKTIWRRRTSGRVGVSPPVVMSTELTACTKPSDVNMNATCRQVQEKQNKSYETSSVYDDVTELKQITKSTVI